MERNRIERLTLGVSKAIQNFLEEIAERLEKMEDVWVVDRIEGTIAVCENRRTKIVQNIDISELPEEVKEGSILKWKQGRYEIDTSKNGIEEQIKKKMEDVWKD